jgi:divalent metal cation (Fe/Co/Zn/Cd) transporter
MNGAHRRALRLEYFTVAYNFVEAGLSLVFGALAGSVALIGFGLDSVVESLSAFVLIWRLRRYGQCSEEEEERVERRALRFVAITFFLLAAYVLYESLRKLILTEKPESSLPGVLIALASVAVMPLLARRKRLAGEAIGSAALIADSRETIACALLSVALLLGLGSNLLFGFWQADPIAGLLIVGFLAKEGWEIWEADSEGDEPG